MPNPYRQLQYRAPSVPAHVANQQAPPTIPEPQIPVLQPQVPVPVKNWPNCKIRPGGTFSFDNYENII